MSIKFIYFDLGGVVILDFSGTNKWEEMTRAMGVTEEIKDKFNELFNYYEVQVCEGRDVESLIPIFNREFNLNIPESYSLLLNFVYRFEKNPGIFPILKEASNKYKVGILSNAYPKMLFEIRMRGIMPPVEWDVVIDSSVVKSSKPNARIFEIAEKRALEVADAKPTEILFVENTQRHIDAAKERGWQTFKYDPRDVEGSNIELSKFILDN